MIRVVLPLRTIIVATQGFKLVNDHNEGLQGLLEQCLTAVLCPCYDCAGGQAEDNVWDRGLG